MPFRSKVSRLRICRSEEFDIFLHPWMPDKDEAEILLHQVYPSHLLVGKEGVACVKGGGTHPERGARQDGGASSLTTGMKSR